MSFHIYVASPLDRVEDIEAVLDKYGAVADVRLVGQSIIRDSCSLTYYSPRLVSCSDIKENLKHIDLADLVIIVASNEPQINIAYGYAYSQDIPIVLLGPKSHSVTIETHGLLTGFCELVEELELVIREASNIAIGKNDGSWLKDHYAYYIAELINNFGVWRLKDDASSG